MKIPVLNHSQSVHVMYNKENLERQETNSLLYSTADEGHCDLAEIFILVSFHLYMLYVLATLTRGPDDALVSLR